MNIQQRLPGVQFYANKTVYFDLQQLSKDINPGTEYVLKIRVTYSNQNESEDNFNGTYFEWPHLETNLVSFIQSFTNLETM